MNTVVNTATGEITEPMTRDERKALNEAEAAIEDGLASFVKVGEALADVRDRRLYRSSHPTFEAYCRDRWEIGKSRAYQLIDAAVVTSTIVDGIQPTNEGQARELSGLNGDEATAVMVQALSLASGAPTAATIRKAREQVAPKPAMAKTVDHAALADAAIAEFPDLAYYRDEVRDLEHCWRLADTLRLLAARGELDERLANLRKSIELDRSKRNGTYVPTPPPVAVQPSTCPTCGQEVN